LNLSINESSWKGFNAGKSRGTSCSASFNAETRSMPGTDNFFAFYFAAFK
jgi:hypothetical protein